MRSDNPMVSVYSQPTTKLIRNISDSGTQPYTTLSTSLADAYGFRLSADSLAVPDASQILVYGAVLHFDARLGDATV